jgi:hypothetical protein
LNYYRFNQGATFATQSRTVFVSDQGCSVPDREGLLERRNREACKPVQFFLLDIFMLVLCFSSGAVANGLRERARSILDEQTTSQNSFVPIRYFLRTNTC